MNFPIETTAVRVAPIVAPNLHRARPNFVAASPSATCARFEPDRKCVAPQPTERLKITASKGATGTKTVTERRRKSSCACTVTETALFGQRATHRAEPDEIVEQLRQRISYLTLGG